MTATEKGFTMSSERKVYIDGKIYVCRGTNIIRVR
ncbi:hypothetical protein SEA_LAKES_86 [Mycobacterium phage Lakes]|uniref:Uncharacterized protein n=3 Tax=Mycobacterium phage D29 TaxID=28369 RepID=A0A8T8JDJ3_BPMD2|nr:hypothetical protein SEA_KERBEROS_97 [Mycobacterium phage Kerberos]AXH48958.1 hypothetical protein SEA_TOMATHAN_97 [Mycobacterium phage Tomathan]QFG08852.1 hypothetical protein SEA_NAJI_86 [Mycobacterium phage Naji]QJD51882.1 hypothetical protein PBI_VC3_93 [Mycobacterium phage VC3]QJD52470.1 hypothetical protein PBI_D32_85 [Mycobacterium phage D32]QJD52556.1 hypothetical protein PBI_ANI8_94 [Mycobacterium phage ANI8]QJD52648.1 hypothetical protein PBI_AN9_94 [Mycobacterium phage AN9]QUE2